MDEKNRFSNLLRQLMTLVNLKNYTLARALQYDVSYISKWVSGRMIPSEKTAQEVLHGISACVVDSAAPEADTFFPNLDKLPGWEVESVSEPVEENGVTYRFVDYINTKI